MDQTVQDYFDAISAPRKAHVQALHGAILECFPEATVDLKYNMPTYSHEDGWVAIANQKNYVSLYTCGAAHLKAFKQKHPDYKTGKGCINFRQKDTIPVEDVKAVVEHAMLHPKAN